MMMSICSKIWETAEMQDGLVVVKLQALVTAWPQWAIVCFWRGLTETPRSIFMLVCCVNGGGGVHVKHLSLCPSSWLFLRRDLQQGFCGTPDCSLQLQSAIIIR